MAHMTTSPGRAAPSLDGSDRGGLRRSVALFRAFRVEQSDPDHFYRFQAADTVDQLQRWTALEGRLVVDLGGGAGYFTEAMVAAGARCVLVEPEAGLSGDHDTPEPPEPPIAADAAESARRERHRLAVAPGRLAPGSPSPGTATAFPSPTAPPTWRSPPTCSSTSPSRPGSSTRWSVSHAPAGSSTCRSRRGTRRGAATKPPRGTTSGGHRAARRYEQRHGRPPGNRFGSSLFACHVGPTLRMARAHRDVEVVAAMPRYYPDWMRWLIEVPGLRELATWNLLLVLRRRATT